ncbi:hypothetical protein BG842_02725 [Haladaptatus sp. W1]|nr:hypothetical protein BG842_02725 [Haladaptatus sp. W1]
MKSIICRRLTIIDTSWEFDDFISIRHTREPQNIIFNQALENIGNTDVYRWLSPSSAKHWEEVLVNPLQDRKNAFSIFPVSLMMRK